MTDETKNADDPGIREIMANLREVWPLMEMIGRAVAALMDQGRGGDETTSLP